MMSAGTGATPTHPVVAAPEDSADAAHPRSLHNDDSVVLARGPTSVAAGLSNVDRSSPETRSRPDARSDRGSRRANDSEPCEEPSRL